MSPTHFDTEAADVGRQLPPGFPVGVIGSSAFGHGESESTCADIGEFLARLDNLVLLTGGVPGVGDHVGRGFAMGCQSSQPPRVIHILPRGLPSRDYGTTLFAGNDMMDRREILGRLARAFIVVEGGPGTEHEATVAAARGALLVPVGRSGGHASALYARVERPPFVDEQSWQTLGDLEARPRVVAAAVFEIVDSIVRHAAGFAPTSTGDNIG